MDTSMSASSAVITTNYSAYQSSNQTNVTGSVSSTGSTSSVITPTAESVRVSESAKIRPPSIKELNALVKEGNDLFNGVSSDLQFQVDDSIGQVVVKIVDRNTDEVIRQIPTVEMVNFIRHMKELEKKSGALLKATV